MHRRDHRLALPVIFGLLLVSGAVWGRGLQGPEFKIHAVAGTVSYIEGAGGNIGVSVGDDGAFVIDDQLERFGDEVEKSIRKAAGDAPIRFLLNTHWHGDHVGNNERFGNEATIMAHVNVRRRLTNDPTLEGRKAENELKESLPVITYEDSITVHLNGEEIVVRHYPTAHTDGDSTVYFTGSKVLHMGDLFFHGRFPYIDLDSGGDVQGFVDAVGKVLATVDDDVQIIPGHGELATKADLSAYRDMLLSATGAVRRALADGKSLEEIQEAKLLEEWAEWGWDFISAERFVEILVKGLG